MARRGRRKPLFSALAEAGSLGGLGALAGLACCGPFFMAWLAQLVFAVGGVSGLHFLVQYEAPILLVVPTLSGLAARLAVDPHRRVNGIVAWAALFFAAVRAVWDINAELVVVVPPAHGPFAYRQPIFATVALLALGLRLALLLKRGRVHPPLPLFVTRHAS